jgi:exonuclease SbcD
MRIIHTSDWHLGQHFYGKSRANEHQGFLTWLLAQVKSRSIDAVIVAGDIFDTGTPPSYAREMYFDFIVSMHQLNCQLVILAGNHDSVAMLGESKKLLGHLSTKVVTCAVKEGLTQAQDKLTRSEILTSEQVFYLQDQKGQKQAVLCAIPFIRPRDIMLSQTGQSATDKQQSLQKAITEHYQALYEQAQQLVDFAEQEDEGNNKLPIIATGHLTTVGVTLSESVRDIYIGTLEAFPASAFPNADYIALGHIHRSQKVAKTEHIRYCGSPIPLSFDEARQEKSVLMVEFEQDKLSTVTPLIIPCFQPIVMVKTTLENIVDQVNDLVDSTKDSLRENQKIWLDIEIQSSDYLQDLQIRINPLIESLPVEILLVRRSQKSRLAMPNNQKKITLNELTLEDVFSARLEKENWQNEDEKARKKRISTLFKQTVEQVQQQNGVNQTEAES